MKIKKVVILLLCSVLVGISCQKEEREFIDESQDNTIPQNSRLAGLMKNIVTHDGSYDDVIDGGNCYSVNLPYTISFNGNEKKIVSIQDYNTIHSSDIIQIEFPITITMHDYVEKKIENKSQLESLAALCSTQDDDIECIDFGYPFKFTTFNSSTNSFKTIEAIHDAQVFGFMSDLDENVSVSIKYPITMILHNGEHTSTAHNTELLSTISDYAVSCDENDETN